jgi:hypothetical protein
MSYSSLATDGLARHFEEAEHKRHLAPGYHTEGFTVAAPQLGDVAEYAQTVFASHYRSRYGADPTPEAVRWYEGTCLIARAIAAKGIIGIAVGVFRKGHLISAPVQLVPVADSDQVPGWNCACLERRDHRYRRRKIRQGSGGVCGHRAEFAG